MQIYVYIYIAMLLSVVALAAAVLSVVLSVALVLLVVLSPLSWMTTLHTYIYTMRGHGAEAVLNQ